MYTYAMTVNSTGNDEQIVVKSVCNKITFGESEGVTNYPTVDWQWRAPDSADYCTRTKGSQMTFTRLRPFQPGELVAYVKTVSGSSTFLQEEF